MDEQSKAYVRRTLDTRFANRWMTGAVLDIGCGPDPVNKDLWPLVTSVVGYDVTLGSKDAQYLPEINNEGFDTVHSAHCLEHMRDARAALANWLRVLKPGGFLVCTVPEELLYESGVWPSRYNSDHKISFTLRSQKVIPTSVALMPLLYSMRADIELVSLVTNGWDNKRFGQDQTLTGAECAIEFVLRKQNPEKVW